MGRRRMSAADAVWVGGDTPTNRVVISAVLWFEGPLDVAELRTRIEERLLDRHPVFRQRVVRAHRPGALPRWVDDRDFDLDAHLRVEVLRPPGAHAELERRCSAERSEPLDPERPPWAATVYEGYRGAGSAIHVRIHHSVGDGLALMQLLITLADEFDPALVPLTDDPPAVLRRLHTVTQAAGALAGVARHPTRAPELARAAAELAGWGGRLLAPTRASRSVLHGRPGGHKRMVWTPDGLPVDALLDASHERGVTANDLLLGILAGGLHRYLVARDALVDEVLVMVPISLRPPGEPLPRHLGNRIGLLPVVLPVGVEDLEGRLRSIRERTGRLKRSPAPAVSRALIAATARVPPRVERAVHRLNQWWSTGVVTNVLGPDLRVHLTGTPLAGVIGWGGVTGTLNLGVAFVSLGGRLHIGIVADEAITPDVDRLLGHLEEEWRQVLPAPVEPAPGPLSAPAR